DRSQLRPASAHDRHWQRRRCSAVVQPTNSLRLAPRPSRETTLSHNSDASTPTLTLSYTARSSWSAARSPQYVVRKQPESPSFSQREKPHPGREGGPVSSVVEIQTRKGHVQPWHRRTY